MNTRLSYLFLYALSPVLGIFTAFKKLNRSNVLFFSVLTLGTFGFLYHYGGSGDGTFHYENAKNLYSDVGLFEFFKECWNIIIQQPSGPVDLYIHFLYFLSSSVLQWPGSLHLWAGIVLGYIIGKTFLLLDFDIKLDKDNKTNLFFLFVLVGIHLIFPLNAIRIGTAMWLALFAIIGYAKTKRLKYVLILGLTLTIHLAYALILVPVISAFFLKRSKVVVVALFAMSFGFQLTSFDATAYLPKTETAEKKAGYIMDKETRQEIGESTGQKRSSLNIYAALGPSLYQQFGIFVLILVFIPLYLKTPISHPVSFVMTVVLLTYAFSNVVVFMPSLVGRVQNLGTVAFLAAGFMWKMSEVRQLTKSWYSSIIKSSHYYLLAASFFYLLAITSHILDITSVYFLALPIFSEYQEADMTIREALIALF